MMKHFEVWAVAAAMLIEARRTLHYKTIAERVIGTGLTRLGIMGETPSQTVGAEMRKHKNVFYSPSRGHYDIAYTTVKDLPDVSRALNTMKHQPLNVGLPSEASQLRERIKTLESQNAVCKKRSVKYRGSARVSTTPSS